MPSPVDEAVARFVRNATTALERLAARAGEPDSGRLGLNAVTEAFDLATAFVDADGNHTDPELWALLSAFAGPAPLALRTDGARRSPTGRARRRPAGVDRQAIGGVRPDRRRRRKV